MKCIETYDGKEFWIEDQRGIDLKKLLLSNRSPEFVDINGALVKTNHISGIYDEIDMQEKQYRKAGMYVCKFMRWHSFKEDCHCLNNFIKYKDFGSCIKSKKCLEYEKINGSLELNLNDNLDPKPLKSENVNFINN